MFMINGYFTVCQLSWQSNVIKKSEERKNTTMEETETQQKQPQKVEYCVKTNNRAPSGNEL